MKKSNPKKIFIFIILLTILTDTYIMPLHVLVKVILTNMWKKSYINGTNLSAFHLLYCLFSSFIKKKFKYFGIQYICNFLKLSIL